MFNFAEFYENTIEQYQSIFPPSKNINTSTKQIINTRKSKYKIKMEIEEKRNSENKRIIPKEENNGEVISNDKSSAIATDKEEPKIVISQPNNSAVPIKREKKKGKRKASIEHNKSTTTDNKPNNKIQENKEQGSRNIKNIKMNLEKQNTNNTKSLNSTTERAPDVKYKKAKKSTGKRNKSIEREKVGADQNAIKNKELNTIEKNQASKLDEVNQESKSEDIIIQEIEIIDTQKSENKNDLVDDEYIITVSIPEKGIQIPEVKIGENIGSNTNTKANTNTNNITENELNINNIPKTTKNTTKTTNTTNTTKTTKTTNTKTTTNTTHPHKKPEKSTTLPPQKRTTRQGSPPSSYKGRSSVFSTAEASKFEKLCEPVLNKVVKSSSRGYSSQDSRINTLNSGKDDINYTPHINNSVILVPPIKRPVTHEQKSRKSQRTPPRPSRMNIYSRIQNKNTDSSISDTFENIYDSKSFQYSPGAILSYSSERNGENINKRDSFNKNKDLSDYSNDNNRNNNNRNQKVKKLKTPRMKKNKSSNMMNAEVLYNSSPKAKTRPEMKYPIMKQKTTPSSSTKTQEKPTKHSHSIRKAGKPKKLEKLCTENNKPIMNIAPLTSISNEWDLSEEDGLGLSNSSRKMGFYTNTQDSTSSNKQNHMLDPIVPHTDIKHPNKYESSPQQEKYLINLIRKTNDRKNDIKQIYTTHTVINLPFRSAKHSVFSGSSEYVGYTPDTINWTQNPLDDGLQLPKGKYTRSSKKNLSTTGDLLNPLMEEMDESVGVIRRKYTYIIYIYIYIYIYI